MAASKSNYKSIVASALKGITTVKSFKDRGSVGRSLEVVNKLLQETEAVIETEPLRVLNVSQAVVEKLLPKLQYLDDSGGFIGACLEHAIGMMYQLSEKAPDGQLRKDWFEWLLKTAQDEDYQGWNWTWDLAKLAAKVASERDEPKIVALAAHLKQLGGNNDPWISQHASEEACLMMMGFIEKHKAKEDVEAFVMANVEVDAIRRIALENLIRDRRYGAAAKLCREGIMQAKMKVHHGLVDQWYRCLLSICRLDNDQKGVIKCATFLFKSEPEIKTYQILKETVDATEWEQYRASLLEQLEKRSPHLLAVISVKENDIERLLSVIKKTNNIGMLNEFGKHLLAKHKLVLQERYFDLLSDQLEWNATRENYKEIAKVLKRMTKDFEKLAIANFANSVRENYKKRPALLQELAKVGL